MRVGLNALTLRPGKVGGTEVYFRNLIAALAQGDQENEYLVLCNAESFRSLRMPHPNFQHALITVPSRPLLQLPKRVVRKVKNVLRGRRPRASFQEDLLAEKLDALGMDVIHHPFSVIYPLSISTPAVLTFWDMQHEFFPQFFSDSVLAWRKENYEASTELARRIIVSSHFTEATLTAQYGVSPGKITTIYFGVGPEFRQPIGLGQIAELRAKYGLSDRLVFYPAATFPHKNHIRLLHAFKRLCDRLGTDIQLALTGAEMAGEADLRQTIQALDLERQVKRLGYVPASELPAMYAAASLMVFPSLFEGYGIPLIEAMTVGCPIACSNASAIPELVGDAALLFDPLDVEAIASAMFRLLKEKDLVDDLTTRGRRQSAKYSWRAAAGQTADLYRSAVKADNTS
jgi:glycosyltransferase involved in cell wall biosynthesis